MKQLFEKLASLQNNKLIKLPIPKSLIFLLASLVGRSAMASRLCSELVVDTSKNTQVLGWKAPYSTEQSLAKMFRKWDKVMVYALIFFVLSFVLTYLMRMYALKKNIIDSPNERSSHTMPTPRGGGVAVVISYLLSLAGLIYLGYLTPSIGIIVIVAGFIIALLGFLDDHGHINALVRLAIHFMVAIGVVVALGGFTEVTIFNGLQLGFVANIIAVLFLVWLLNLYNFMDGINGIASIEAITSVLSMALIYWVLNSTLNSQVLSLMAATVFGFMLWNFPKAKIFMGDACSGF